MILNRQKYFSIQSGGPNQGGSLKRELSAKLKEGAFIGGVTGSIGGIIPGLLHAASRESLGSGAKMWAGITVGSAIIGSIALGLTALGANKRRAIAEGLTMNEVLDHLYNIVDYYKAETTEINVERYIEEDRDPRNFMVNFSYEDGKLIIYLNKPSNNVIQSLNESLEEVVKYHRKADYAAEPVNDGFIIYVIIPGIDQAAWIIYNTIAETKVKVNALTEKSLNKSKLKTFSDGDKKKETAQQKKTRRKTAASIALLGAGTGMQIGAINAKLDNNKFAEKATEKLKNAASKDKEMVEKVTKRAEDLVREGKVDPRSMDHFLRTRAIPRLQNNIDATLRFKNRAEKIARKRYNNKILKGTATGTAIGIGAGALVNKSMKDKNTKK